MREHLGLYGSYLQFSSPHQRSLHHPVSLSFLTVFVPASSSITHPIPRVSLNRSHLRLLLPQANTYSAQADVTLDVACSVLGPSRHIPFVLSFPFKPSTRHHSCQTCSPVCCNLISRSAPADTTVRQPTTITSSSSHSLTST